MGVPEIIQNDECKQKAAKAAQKRACSGFLKRLRTKRKIPARIATKKLAKERIPFVPTGTGGAVTIVATTVITQVAIWVSVAQFFRIADQFMLPGPAILTSNIEKAAYGIGRSQS
jgi:hypothetical protein